MEENHVTEKVYCYDHPSAYKQDNSAMWAALMSKNNDCNPMAMASMMNSQWDNPFIYLVWMMFAGRFFGNNGWGNGNEGENYNSRQIAALQDVVNTNHNNDLALQAINGNRDAMGQLAQTFNCDFGQMQQAICGIKSTIEQVGGQIGYTGESVKNAIALGDSNIIQQMCSCCCQQKELIQRMGYENQLGVERQTNTLMAQMAQNHSSDQLQDCQYHGQTMNRIDQLANGIQQGFSQIGFQSQQNLTSVLQNNNVNTQRIIDTLNNHWTQDLQQRYQDARLELSQQAQNAYLVSQLKTT